MLEQIPTYIDPTENWLVDYWAKEMGVSSGRLIQAIGTVGHEVSMLKKHIKDGYRIAVCDDSRTCRLIARITLEKGGFAISVPYFQEQRGYVIETPLQYYHKSFVVPLDACKQYTVDDSVKLSLHMNGFVQFSSGGGRPIVSGYCNASREIKGAGVWSSNPVNVTTGPLCGVIAQGLSRFELKSSKLAEVFDVCDRWHHPDFSSLNDTAYNIEMFMFPRSELSTVEAIDGKRILKRKLPFNAKFQFDFTLRVLELPHQPYFLGVIVSRMQPKGYTESGYTISGPGCCKDDGQVTSITAMYPRPEFVDKANVTSLNYLPNEFS